MTIPKLSVVIATKNHYETLIPVVDGLLNEFNGKDVQFVISDNTPDNTQFKEFLTTIGIPEITYIHTPMSISVTENYDIGVNNANGEYVTMIGDDDFVLRSILQHINWMESNDVDCLVSAPNAYYWPDMEFNVKLRDSQPGLFVLGSKLTREYKEHDTHMELMNLIKKGGAFYTALPNLYHGVVRRRVLEEIYHLCSTFFPGPSPDMASSTALSMLMKIHYSYGVPFVISGKSSSSASGLSAKGMHFGDLYSYPHLDFSLIQRWDNRIPFYWSPRLIYAQSVSHCLKCFNMNKTIDYSFLYASILVYESKLFYSKKVYKYINRNLFNVFTFVKNVFVLSVLRGINLIKRIIITDRVYKVESIQHISSVLDEK